MVDLVTEYSEPVKDIADYEVIVLLEQSRNILLMGSTANDPYIKNSEVNPGTLVIHISGNVRFDNAAFSYIPSSPKPFGYMSFTADYVDPKAVVDLHTAGLSVAEGMLKANSLGLRGERYKTFLETYFPALSFDEEKYW
jgi:hypothetical protein